MIAGLDADVLVHWWMSGSPRHRASAAYLARHVQSGGRIAVVSQVLREALHVCTDPRRFRNPMPMAEAIRRARALWSATDVDRVVPGPQALLRTLELMERFGLGRKRILDTALAAALEEAGVRQLLTGNGGDFSEFGFLDTECPWDSDPASG